MGLLVFHWGGACPLPNAPAAGGEVTARRRGCPTRLYPPREPPFETNHTIKTELLCCVHPVCVGGDVGAHAGSSP